MKFRMLFIRRFEEQFRVKQNGGMGRFTPNAYELECYRLHNMRPPEVVQRIPEPVSPNPVIIQQAVDPEALERAVAAELDRRAAAAPAAHPKR